jgi:putative FmdB family regulatory protein
MPLYEYKCHSCGGVFEVIQKFSDEPIEVQKGCGGSLEMVISPSAFQFKGSGWYVTDYARAKDGPNGKEAPSKEEKKETPSTPEPAKVEKPAASKP